MQIHTVKRNDNLWNLSKTYGVPVEHIAQVNEIDEQLPLVIGQALIIPTVASGNTHIVQAGESLWSIARRYGVSIQDIMTTNQLQNPAMLQTGQLLTIPAPTRPEIEVNAYLDRFDETGVNDVKQHAAELTYVACFSYAVTSDGELEPLQDEAVIEAAIASGVAPMMTITNILDEGFSGELIHQVLNDDMAYHQLIATVSNTMNDKGFKALNIDFEYVPPDDRELYNQFLRDITTHLHQFQFLVSSALAPKYSSGQSGVLYEAHDYRAHGEILDFVVIMTYEWGWTGGPPRAVAPINEVMKVITYAISEIPAHKILLGVPLYGYHWTLPFVEGTSRAVTVNNNSAVTLAREKKAEILYDQTAESPYFSFYDEQKVQHIVWYEDARSIQAKFNLVKRFGLRGVSYWKLGIPFPANWYLLSENFTIKKLI